MSTIETINKPTRQKTTISNDYAASAGYDHEGGRHKIFQKLSSLLTNCGIDFVFIPRITTPGITFLIPRLNNSTLSLC